MLSIFHRVSWYYMFNLPAFVVDTITCIATVIGTAIAVITYKGKSNR